MLVSAVLAAFMLFSTVLVRAQSRGGSQGGGQRGDARGGSQGGGQSGDTAKDPGPRGAPIGAGSPVAGLTPQQLAFFQNGLSQFIEVEGVLNPSPGNGGLGPAFNNDSCGGCHSQPATGGTSPSTTAYPYVGPNPQVTAGQVAGGTNTVPFFVTATGPIREARFKSDGGVHDLFTIQGRNDTGGVNTCTMTQPDFEQAEAENNLSFRIPTPVFGVGLLENISENTLLANVAASANPRLGIQGVFNRSGNDGSITRFGWKAQNKSGRIFAGEAYNVEMGVTNEMFTTERGQPPNQIPAGCLINPTPEDRTIFESTTPGGVPSDVDLFSDFMRFLDQPTPACTGAGCSPSIQHGNALFKMIGCASCHTPSMMTYASENAPAALGNVQVNLFSDLALHHMGAGLNDGITQGNAGPDQFRTALLWGIGQRIYFLHDGRTSDLMQAILAHQSQGSEANQVINNFNRLQPFEQQAILNFLRSL
jgi:CxxC motif-containing protein (DUF1111 family)